MLPVHVEAMRADFEKDRFSIFHPTHAGEVNLPAPTKVQGELFHFPAAFAASRAAFNRAIWS